MKAIKQLFHVIILLYALKGGVIITPIAKRGRERESDKEGLILKVPMTRHTFL